MRTKLLFILLMLVGIGTIALIYAQYSDPFYFFQNITPTQTFEYNTTSNSLTTNPALSRLYPVHSVPGGTIVEYHFRVDQLMNASITFQLLGQPKNSTPATAADFEEIMTKTISSQTWPDNEYCIKIQESYYNLALGVKYNITTTPIVKQPKAVPVNEWQQNHRWGHRWPPIIDNVTTAPNIDHVTAYISSEAK